MEMDINIENLYIADLDDRIKHLTGKNVVEMIERYYQGVSVSRAEMTS